MTLIETPMLTLLQAKADYLERLGVREGWHLLHDDAEADFTAGHESSLPADRAVAEFSERIDGHPDADLRLEDFTAGLGYRR